MGNLDLRLAKYGVYFAVYNKIFAFHKKHINARTDDEWLACAEDLGQFKTPLEVELALAVINELERDRGKGNKDGAT